MKKLIFIILLIPIIFFSCKKTSSDKTAPTLTLKGLQTFNSEKDSTYVDAGATAYDETDGDISSNIVVVNPVDIHTIDTYYITYNVKDKAGNSATEVKRKVVVSIF